MPSSNNASWHERIEDLIQGIIGGSVSTPTTTTLPQLTAPGSTAAVACGDARHITVYATVASIDTNVVIRIEGCPTASVTDADWVNLDASDTDTTITANGRYGFSYIGLHNFVRLRFVSESGGTAATIDTVILVGA